MNVHTAVGEGNRSSSIDESSSAGGDTADGKQSTASGSGPNGHTVVGEGIRSSSIDESGGR